MAAPLDGATAAFLVADDGVEVSGLHAVRQRLARDGATAMVVAPGPRPVRTRRGLVPAGELEVDRTTAELDERGLDVLVVTGGALDADRLRLDATAVQLVRHCCDAGVLVAALGHALWLLVEAGAVWGRTVTAWPSLRTDVLHAGGTWADAPVTVCPSGRSVLVTGRGPGEAAAFGAAVSARLRHQRRDGSPRRSAA